MEDNLEISPISNTSNCSKCLLFIENPESNHTSCRQHRICFNKEGYNPEACDICCVNRDNWFDDSNDEAIDEWKKTLVAHQKNSKVFSFIYGSTFNNFFKKNKRPLSTPMSSRKSETSKSSKVSSPSFESKLGNTDIIKNIHESLNRLTQYFLPSHATSSSTRRDSIITSSSPSPSPRRTRSPTKRLALDRPSRSRTPLRSRSPIKSVTPQRHSLSPTVSNTSTSGHPYDIEDPLDFKSDHLQLKY